MKCKIFEKAMKRSMAVPCEIIKTIEIEDELGAISYVEIVKGNSYTRNCIGIHRYKPSDREIEMAVDTAFRDGFNRIYIYGGF